MNFPLPQKTRNLTKCMNKLSSQEAARYMALKQEDAQNVLFEIIEF